MAFRIPFNEHVIIEADTASEIRDLVREFGVELAGRRMLPPPVTESAFVGTIVEEPSHSEPPPLNGKKRMAKASLRPKARVPADDDETASRILAVLKDGAMSPKDVAKSLGIERPALRWVARHLEDRGILKTTGATANRKWMLATSARSGKSEKEAPSRRRSDGPEDDIK